MKASELIERLKELIEKEGDLEMQTNDPSSNTGINSDTVAVEVEKVPDYPYWSGKTKKVFVIY